MDQTGVHKKFIFNDQIDGSWLYSLYEDDYSYILEVFTGSLDSLKEELRVFTGAFESNDPVQLKQSIHKIKPLLGFAGMLHHQEMAGRFENACANAQNTSNLTMQYIEMVELINGARSILQDEVKRLNAFVA
jgi:HPt (histidine-containing phosphotransfer) domain-containing protein